MLDWHAQPEAAMMLPASPSDLLERPLPRAVFELAWPAISSMVVIMLFSLVDTWYIGKLGADMFAAVSAASFIVWAVQSISLVISEGVNAMVARFVGARDPHTAGRVVGQALLMTAIIALVTSLSGLALQNRTLQAMGLEGKVLQAANEYLAVFFYGVFISFSVYAVDAAFRGMGDTKTPLKIISFALFLNAVLDPLLIFGLGPFPRLEVAGAAWATVLAHIVALVWSFVALSRKPVRLVLDRRSGTFFDLSMMLRIARIGAPIAANGFFFSLSYMALTRVISVYGSDALAALGVSHRIEGVCYNVAVGFSIAAATLVGQNLGAGRPERAEKAVALCVLYVSVFTAVVSLSYFFVGGKMIAFFVDEPAVVVEGARYLKIVSYFTVMLGFEVVYEGAFSGAGDTVPPMVISIPLTWARIPLALLLAEHGGWGSSGIWWAVGITTGLKGIVMALWFMRGRWKKKQV